MATVCGASVGMFGEVTVALTSRAASSSVVVKLPAKLAPTERTGLPNSGIPNVSTADSIFWPSTSSATTLPVPVLPAASLLRHRQERDLVRRPSEQ